MQGNPDPAPRPCRRIPQFDARPHDPPKFWPTIGETEPRPSFAGGHVRLKEALPPSAGKPMPLSITSMEDFSACGNRQRHEDSRPRSPGSLATAAIASVAFFTMFVRPLGTTSRRSNGTWTGTDRESFDSNSISGCAMAIEEQDLADEFPQVVAGRASVSASAAKNENSSTMRLMSSTCRTIVAVHWSNTSRSSVMTCPICCTWMPFGRKLDRRQGVLDLDSDAAGHVGPGRTSVRAAPDR